MRKILIIIFLIFMVFLVCADDQDPVTVSPGEKTSMTIIEQSCPTFSWTAVSWAAGYRIAVFKADRFSMGLSYEEKKTQEEPVLMKDIKGSALSWTPCAKNRLTNGQEYVWFVQAIDVNSSGVWSEGNSFKVVTVVSFASIEEKLKEKLEDSGVSSESIARAFEEVKISDTGDSYAEKRKETDNNNPGISKPLGTENANYTYYGIGAGGTSTAAGNSFFGVNAGAVNGLGTNNTFSGMYAGYSNTTGVNNTFSGYYAGRHNTTGNSNTFSGYQAGYSNITGNGNLFLGFRAGYNESGSNKLYIENSNIATPLIYGEFDNDLVKINGNFRVTGNFSLDNGTTTISSTELNLLDGKTSVVTGTSNNDKLVTQGYVDDNSGGLTGSALTDQYISKWDNANTRLINSLILENGTNIGINGSLSLNNYTLSLNNGTTTISSTELNLLDGKTSVATGTSNNDKLVTQGYVDENDDIGSSGTQGTDNTFFGLNAGASTTGQYNSFFGAGAGYTNTAGIGNTFIGYEAGKNTTSSNSTFIGMQAGVANTTGGGTFIGINAGNQNTTGTNNTFVGGCTGINNTTGHQNTFIGCSAAQSNTTGNCNTFSGYRQATSTPQVVTTPSQGIMQASPTPWVTGTPS